MRERYRALLTLGARTRRKLSSAAFWRFVVVSFGLWPFLGENFFPRWIPDRS